MIYNGGNMIYSRSNLDKTLEAIERLKHDIRILEKERWNLESEIGTQIGNIILGESLLRDIDWEWESACWIQISLLGKLGKSDAILASLLEYAPLYIPLEENVELKYNLPYVRLRFGQNTYLDSKPNGVHYRLDQIKSLLKFVKEQKLSVDFSELKDMTATWYSLIESVRPLLEIGIDEI